MDVIVIIVGCSYSGNGGPGISAIPNLFKSRQQFTAYSICPGSCEKPVQMEIDTGASVSILSSATYEEKFTAKPLQASPVKLRTYADKPLQNLGSISVPVKHNSQEMQLPVLVVAGNDPNLLGRDWLEKLQINWKAIDHLRGAREEVSQLCSEFAGVFQSGLGTLKVFKASIKVDKEATPVFCKARPVPYAMKPLVEKELEHLEKAVADLGFLKGWFLIFFSDRVQKGYHDIKFIHNSIH